MNTKPIQYHLSFENSSGTSMKDEVLPLLPAPGYSRKLILYKYVSAKTLRRILEDGRMKITFREDANDPFECLPKGEDPETSSHLEDMGFLSLSASNNVPSLWGNYADCYRGACIELQIPIYGIGVDRNSPSSTYWIMRHLFRDCYGLDVYQHRRQRKGEGGERLVMADGGDIIVKCRYENERADPSSIKPKGFVPEEFEEALCTTAQKLLPIIHKDIGWENEQEYRAAFFRENCDKVQNAETGKILYFTSTYMRYITRIITTPRFEVPQEEMERLVRRLQMAYRRREPNVRVVRASFSPDTFRLEIPEE